VGGCGPPDLQGLHDDIPDVGVVDRLRRARPRFVEQPVKAALDKAPNATCHAAFDAEKKFCLTRNALDPTMSAFAQCICEF
jgi:hypothetical protein